MNKNMKYEKKTYIESHNEMEIDRSRRKHVHLIHGQYCRTLADQSREGKSRTSEGPAYGATLEGQWAQCVRHSMLALMM
jgi:hypothetical protein